MITIKTFDNAVDAYLLKSRFKNEGIPSYIIDENIVTLNRFYSNPVGGIKLCVSELDVGRANRVLAEIEEHELRDHNGNRISCARCNSTSFYVEFKTIRNLKGVVSFLISLFFVVYTLYYKTVKRCKNCGFEF